MELIFFLNCGYHKKFGSLTTNPHIHLKASVQKDTMFKMLNNRIVYCIYVYPKIPRSPLKPYVISCSETHTHLSEMTCPLPGHYHCGVIYYLVSPGVGAFAYSIKCRLWTDYGLFVFRVRKQYDYCCHVLICMVYGLSFTLNKFFSLEISQQDIFY